MDRGGKRGDGRGEQTYAEGVMYKRRMKVSIMPGGRVILG